MKPLDSATLALVDAVGHNASSFEELTQIGSAICQGSSGSKTVNPQAGLLNRTTITDYKITACQPLAGGAPARPVATLAIEDRATFGVDLISHSYTATITRLDPNPAVQPSSDLEDQGIYDALVNVEELALPTAYPMAEFQKHVGRLTCAHRTNIQTHEESYHCSLAN